jgi:hypothetical protein
LKQTLPVPLRVPLPGTAFALLVAALTCTVSAPAFADVKQACVEASTEGQALRDATKLQEARTRFVSCARDACPSIVRKYCAEWLTDIERRLSSVVFRVQSADGADVLGARLFIDGQPQPHGLDGSALPLDPGEHAVRIERDAGDPLEQRIMILEGEKGRVVTVRLAPPALTAPTPPPATDAPPPASHPLTVSPLTLVLGGVGILGVASFTYFGLTAQGDLNHLRQTCAPRCASSDLDSVKREALAADISLGVGVVAVGVAIYTLFAHHAPPAATNQVGLTPTPGGAIAELGGRF